MESEKVKEIKKAWRCCGGLRCHKCPYIKKGCEIQLIKDTFTLINELERVNERLLESCKNCHYIKDLEIANGHAKELKDRIAELETKNKALTDGIKQEISYKKVERDKLYKLVEDVKKFTKDNVDADKVDGFVAINIYLDKLLKEEG